MHQTLRDTCQCFLRKLFFFFKCIKSKGVFMRETKQILMVLQFLPWWQNTAHRASSIRGCPQRTNVSIRDIVKQGSLSSFSTWILLYKTNFLEQGRWNNQKANPNIMAWTVIPVFHFTFTYPGPQHPIHSLSSKGHCYTLCTEPRRKKKKWGREKLRHTHTPAVCGRSMKRRWEEAEKPNLTLACQPIASHCCTSFPLLIINSLLGSKPGCFCHKPQPTVLQPYRLRTKRLHKTKAIEGLFFSPWSLKLRIKRKSEKCMLNISTFRHALNCKYMSNPSGFSFGDFNSCMVFITTGKTLSNKLPVRLPVVLHHNYWNIFGISQEVQIMKNPPNFLLAQT